mmetsp:Transcript_14110/g.57322  ORF Transcript_14110/g.57322 Transcript_14110/m.57322 type:complete len:205 (-) Transcript_14110:812-1426(-)
MASSTAPAGTRPPSSECPPNARGELAASVPAAGCPSVGSSSGSSSASSSGTASWPAASASISFSVDPAATSAAGPRKPVEISFAEMPPSSASGGGLFGLFGLWSRISREGVFEARREPVVSPGASAENAGMATVAAAMSSAASKAEVVVGVGRSSSPFSRFIDRSLPKMDPSASASAMSTESSPTSVGAKRLSAGDAEGEEASR